MSWVKFPVIKVKATRAVRCQGCKKPMTRTKTFECTINPFNKNSDGSIKSASEVREQAQALADKWNPEPIRCGACK